jgi:hypothetical protein
MIEDSPSTKIISSLQWLHWLDFIIIIFGTVAPIIYLDFLD